MNTLERINYLNKILLEEMPQYKADAATFPDEIHAQRRLLRSLMNLRQTHGHEPARRQYLRPG